jgi:hypothetical protein
MGDYDNQTPLAYRSFSEIRDYLINCAVFVSCTSRGYENACSVVQAQQNF